MKRAWLIVVVAVGSAGSGRAGRAANLVPNGDFEGEVRADGMPEGWRLSVPKTDYRAKGGRCTQSRSGQYSFCVENAMARPGTMLASSRLDLKPNTLYEVSAWLRMDGCFPKDSVRLRVGTDDVGSRRSFDLMVTRQWRKFTGTFSTQAETTSADLQFHQLGGQAERLYIDDVAVRETEAGVERPPVYRTDLAGFEFLPHRPRVEHTTEEIDEIKHSLAERDAGEHAWVKQAEPWLERQLHFFEEGCGEQYFRTGRNCPVDAARLRPIAHPDGTTEMQCPKCEKIYAEEAHRAVARGLLNAQMAQGARALGRAYALTGDERYARRAAEILIGFAGRYKHWGGGHAVHYYLHEPYAFLTPCATAYDYIYVSGVLSAEDHERIETDLLRVGGDFYSDWADTNGRLNNRGAIHNEAVMSIGVAIADKRFVDQALNSPHSGFHVLAANLFLEDGLCWEGFGYHTYTVSGLSPIAEKAYRVGINVYRDPAYRRVFESPLKVLLPGEELMPGQYRIVCPRFSEVGEPMQYPFSEEAQAAGLPSHNFQDFGFGVLRSGEGDEQVYLSMEYGKEAMFMGHAPTVKSSLGLYANGRLLTPRGAATYGDALCGGWSRRSLAHNSMTVDERDQWGRTVAGPDPDYSRSKLAAFEAAPRVKVMRAADDGAYGEIILDRTLFLADGFVVDFSGARGGGRQHRVDLCYRLTGTLHCDLPFEPRNGPLGAAHGYQYLTGARSAHTGETWSADWRQAEDSALRLWVLGGSATDVIACASPGNTSSEESVDAVVARRWGPATVFASVWEPYRRKPKIARLAALPVKGAKGGTEVDAGVGVEVVRDGEPGAECFLVSYTPARKRFGDIELDGKLAAGRWTDPQAAPDYMHLVGGVLFKRGAHAIEASAPASVYVEQVTPDRLLLKMGAASAGPLTLRGTLAGEATVQRDGAAVDAEIEPKTAVTFDAAHDAAYQIAGVAAWERIKLEVEAPASQAVPPEVSEPATAIAPEPAVEATLAPDGTLAGKNKIANAGFEVNHKTHPDVVNPWQCWSSYHFASFRADYGIDTEVARSGNHSLRIVETNWANEATRDGWIEQKVPGCGANKTYTLSAWVKASKAPTRVRLALYGFHPNWGNDFDGGVSPTFDVGTEWQRIHWTRSFGPEITRVHVMIKREHQVLGGNVWIDDVQLEEGDEPTAFVPDAWTRAMHNQE